MAGCQEPGPLEELRDTVKPYGRHALAFAGWTTWPAKLVETDGLLGRMSRDVKGLADHMQPPPKFTASRTKPAGDGIDLLIFPDQVVYRGLDRVSWDRVLQEHLANGRPVATLDPEPMPGHHILVCNHGARDVRCGACGPLVADALEKAIEARGLADVHVHRTSHVGGHRFAGNVIVYPGGQWYGYVRPDNVDHLLEKVLADEVWAAHARGAMLGPS